ncbi:MAG: hypothetical protein FJY82_08165 [Candidatus Aminicenantes bacterium]|nr:hypothetical protein [Candidatus Aminicenantes bacterium]
MTAPGTGKEKLARLAADPSSRLLLRGELFISYKRHVDGGLHQTPKELVEFVTSIGADVFFYHWTESSLPSDLQEAKALCSKAGLGFGLTIDGPFERLAKAEGLLSLLQEMGRRSSALKRRIAAKVEMFEKDLRTIGIIQGEPVLICEDMAYDRSMYFSPLIFREWLLPIYRRLFAVLSLPGSLWGWHSDGNLLPILPDLVNLGTRFFSLEAECVDLLEFKRQYRDQVTLIAGLRTAWLLEEGWELEEDLSWVEEIRALVEEGGLILSSTCGLHDAPSLLRLRKIYRTLDASAR